jgi:hypothetical protein
MGGLVVVQSSRANTNAAKSTSCASSRRRSSAVVPGLKECGPGIYVRDVFETACQRLQQLLLHCRRAKEDAGLVHPFLRQQVGAAPVAVTAASQRCWDAQGSAGNNPRLRPYLIGSRRAPRPEARSARRAGSNCLIRRRLGSANSGPSSSAPESRQTGHLNPRQTVKTGDPPRVRSKHATTGARFGSDRGGVRRHGFPIAPRLR